MRNVNKGFTLIEILVSISIVAILVAISIFGIQGARVSSRDTKRKVDLEQIRSALELYRADYNKYPLMVSESGGWEVSSDGDWLENLPSNYLPNKPVDPINNNSYRYQYAVCSGSATPTGQPNYKLYAHLEGESGKICSWCSGSTGGGGWECVTSP